GEVALIDAGDRHVVADPVDHEHEEGEEDFVPQFGDAEDVGKRREHRVSPSRASVGSSGNGAWSLEVTTPLTSLFRGAFGFGCFFFLLRLLRFLRRSRCTTLRTSRSLLLDLLLLFPGPFPRDEL